MPSISISPYSGSQNLNKNDIIVDFPQPDVPTNATLFPAYIYKLKLSKMYIDLDSYLNLIFLNFILPYIFLFFICFDFQRICICSSSLVSRIFIIFFDDYMEFYILGRMLDICPIDVVAKNIANITVNTSFATAL